MTDIDCKIDALHLSWVKRLFDGNDHQWKYIPKALLQTFDDGIFFPSFSPKPLNNALPKFYKNILNKWAGCSTKPNFTECIYTQPLWNNAHFKIAGTTVDWRDFSSKGIKYLYQLINANNRFKSWINFQAEFGLSSIKYFKYIQLIDSIPFFFREIIYANEESFQPVATRGCGMWHNSRFIPINRLISSEIYWILVRKRNHEPTAKMKHIENFPNLANFIWSNIYMLPRKITQDSYLRVFQYKIPNNILYLNKKLHSFGKVNTPLCSFCESHDESLVHLFSECSHSSRLWIELKNFFAPNLILPTLDPRIVSCSTL